MIECSEELLNKFVLALKREGMFNNSKLNAFQKTEQLLYKRSKFVEAVNSKKERIKELKEHGLKRQSKSITKYGAGSGEIKTETEKLEDKIQAIESTIDDTEQHIQTLDSALDKLKHDKFFAIIEMKYSKGMTHEEIGFEFDVDATTIGRNKNRLIKELSIQLFPDDVLNEILT